MSRSYWLGKKTPFSDCGSLLIYESFRIALTQQTDWGEVRQKGKE